MLVAGSLSPSLYLPLTYLFATGLTLLLRRPARAWWMAELLSVCALLGALVHAGGAIWQGLSSGRLWGDPLGDLLALLVTFLGWVVVRFSRRYLAGEPGQARFIVALTFILASISVVVTTGNLLVLALAWTASSLGLHVLLTFYRQRRGALVAAHKKFLVSRFAELCLLAALFLIFRDQGSFTIDKILAGAGQHPGLGLQVAMLLIAVAVVLKSAQLPMHGWLIQVMEAPTPVSALLHAGIVNIGGFILIRLAPLLSNSPVAEGFLLASGLFTALVAGLVMITSNTVKERLAWSTCSQMGFMLLECAMGFYELALLHLVAHSVYKAHAFLTAGETVARTRYRQMLSSGKASSSRVGLVPRLFAGVLAVGVVIGSSQVWVTVFGEPRPEVVALVIIGLGLAPLIWEGARGQARSLALRLLGVLLLAQAYLFWHAVFHGLYARHAMPATDFTRVFVVSAFGLAYAAQCWISCRSFTELSGTLHRVFHTGLALDEWFTRLSFHIWPLRSSALELSDARI